MLHEDLIPFPKIVIGGTETSDQRGREWEPIKISFEIDPSAYIPEITSSPHTEEMRE